MRAVTYFPVIHNVHLTKDVGLIPLHLSKLPGTEAVLAGHFPDEDYPALRTEAAGLSVLRLPDKGKSAFLDRAFLIYLKKHAREVDVLQLYHLSRDSLIYGIYYKRYNPKGVLWLKLDAYNAAFEEPKRYSRSPVKDGLLRMAEKKFLRKADLVTVENRAGIEVITNTYAQLAGKLMYLPNGANDPYIARCTGGIEKEKRILSVGRPGSPDKNYELLMAALPHLELPEGWQIEVVGPCTPAFESAWREAALQYPETAARITFSGALSDRAELYRKYARSSVFFLPSRVESFGIAYAEALINGNVLTGHTGMYAYPDLSGGGMYGTCYSDNDPASFADALKDAVAMSAAPDFAEKAREFAVENFSWSKIAAEAWERIQSLRGDAG